MDYFKYEIQTRGEYDIVNIDEIVDDALRKSNLEDGIILVYTPHTTAAITINENGDPDVKGDLIKGFNKIYPKRDEYLHFEGNSNAHILSSLVGASESLIFENRKIIRGMWQSIYLCEFDGPRERKVYIKII